MASSSLWINERKYEQRHSAITTYTVVKGGIALVCAQPESQLQRLFHSYLSLIKIKDISRDSFSRGQVTQNGDCPQKSRTSGHPIPASLKTH